MDTLALGLAWILIATFVGRTCLFLSFYFRLIPINERGETDLRGWIVYVSAFVIGFAAAGVIGQIVPPNS